VRAAHAPPEGGIIPRGKVHEAGAVAVLVLVAAAMAAVVCTTLQ
jgi:hypothetical protein